MPQSEDVLDAYNRFYKHNLVCNVQYSTLASWWSHWEQYGELPAETSKRLRRENLRFRTLPPKTSDQINEEMFVGAYPTIT